MPDFVNLGPHRGKVVDARLETVVRDLLAHDDRVRDLPVRVSFSGGVAHLTGEVRSDDELFRLRTLLAHLAGVHAIWDRVEAAGSPPRSIDLGAGDVKQYEQNIGVDMYPGKGVNVIADLTRPLPFATDSIDRIYAVHVLEHIVDVVPLLGECHRVLRERGILHVISPHWRSINAVADPTHVRFFDIQTFKHFCRQHPRTSCWRPLSLSCDGANVFADLAPVKGATAPVNETTLTWFFD